MPFPREGWLGYKILCARTLNDNQMALNYLDSLMDYHHSVGSCYPANHLLKAQFMEQMGRFEDACEVINLMHILMIPFVRQNWTSN